ncbi:MAG: hypothetical protein PHO02_06865 [Candidatus Nanoarchaeia archaeon]|nr:hypothetical protein [Candidatus Nanoarchaeia archaeon]
MGYMLLKEKASFMSLVIICAMFSIYLINPVSAEDTAADTSENLGCCERTNSGESCRYTNVEDCNTEGYQAGPYQRCEDSSFCKVGCCISPDGGCSKQVSKATCESAGEGYTWNPDATCNIEKCQKGCCVLGGVECKYTTAKRCSGITADFEGLEIDFRNAVGSEQECTDICKQQDDGCCVKATGECTRTTRGMCGLSDGTGSDGFYKDSFCSNELLQNACDPKCKPQAKMGCVAGLEDVYWFDSCGNREGVVTETIEGSDNPEGNGNCDYARGTLCSSADANHDTAYCKSVNCKAEDVSNYEQIEYDGVSRYNGESWCVYDSKPGPSSDTVGSRHWRHICINGEEVVEPCKDYREEYCTQMDVEGVPPDYVNYRESACVPNKAESCTLECNTAKEAEGDAELRSATRADQKCCESTKRSCVWQWTNEEQTEGMCLPGVPPGINFWGDENGDVNDEAKALCDARSTELPTQWRENAMEGLTWECIGSCQAYSLKYLQTNSLLCNSAGDCGAGYNYNQDWNNEAYWRDWDKWSPSESDKKNFDENDIVEGYEKSTIFSKEGIGDGIYQGKVDYNDIHKGPLTSDFSMTGGEITGWVFTGLAVASYLGFMLGASILSGTFMYGLGAAGVAASLTAGATAAGAAEIGTQAIGQLGTLGYVSGTTGWVPIVGWVVVAVMAIIMAFLLGFTFGADSEERTVTTTCQPWVAPVGGDNCGLCDEDPMHPCSEYRCRSLGQQCKFIAENEGTTKGSCYNEDPNDVTRPNIKPWYADDGSEKYPLSVWKRLRTSEGPQRVEVHSEYPITVLPSSTQYNSGYEIIGELPSFSTIEFGIKTDNKPSQCKYDTEFKPDMTFATAGSWFGDNYFSKEHNMTIYGLLPNKTYEYYIICRGANGYPKEDERVPPFKITFETGEGPDLEPPIFVGAVPENNGYIKAGDNADVLFYVDEVSPYKCKMAKADLDFNLMDMNLSCVTHAPESMLSAYGMCAANLSLQQGVNTYYIRCKDYPTSGTASNMMEESYVYTVIQSEPLEITSVSPPAGTVYYTRNITMQVATAKGAFSGKAICSYEETTTRMIHGEFFATDAAYHEQTLGPLPKMTYNMQIDCYDSVGNEASATTNFSVEADTIPPNVIALYKDASGLHLTLDEEASCEYSNTRFSYGTGTSASTESETATFPVTMTKYYIICRDKFGNTMPEIIVKTEV